MKQAFILQGLDCAACAAKLERAIGKIDGVRHASVSFLTGKMTIEAEEGRMGEIINAARAAVRRMEPGVQLTCI